MVKKATFEVATLADAVSKAARVAPNKGNAFDRVAGIVLEIDPARMSTIVIKSTDLQLSFRQEVNVLSMGDEVATWRLPSSLFASIMSTLPVTSGSTIIMAEKEPSDGYVYFQSGKTKAKLRYITGDYPAIELLPPATLNAAQGFARRMAQVAWACDKNVTNTLGGVHVDGQFLYGCNRQVAAKVPCPVVLDHPITAPLSELSALIKNTSEVNIRATDTKLYLMPDPYTQMSSVLYADKYPSINAIFDREQYTHTLSVNVEALKAALDRMLILVKSERFPVTTIEIAEGVMRLVMEVVEVGRIADEVEIEGGSETPFQVSFTPGNLIGALDASGRPRVIIDYGPTPMSQIRLRDDSDFVAVIMPRKVGDNS